MKKYCWVLALGFISLANAFGDALDNWTKVATTPYGGFSQIFCSNGTFVALSSVPYIGFGIVTNGFSVSSDGTRWTHYSFFSYPSGISYHNGTYVMASWDPSDAGDSGTLVAETNLANFSLQVSPGESNALIANGQYGLTFGYANGNSPLFVAVGYEYEGADEATILTSANGSNWFFQRASTSNLFPTGVSFGNNNFVMVCNSNGFETNTRVLMSSDATNWTLVAKGFTASLPGLAGISFVNSNFYSAPYVSSGYATNGWSTSNGVAWTKVSIPYPSLYASDVYFNGIYLSVHPGYPLATSYDATNWTTRNTGITNALTCAAYGDNCVVLCAADGSIFRSGSTIPTLAPEGTFTNGGFQLTVTNAFNSACQIQASADLVHWTNIATCSNVQGSTQIVDPNASRFSQRFYRTVVQ